MKIFTITINQKLTDEQMDILTDRLSTEIVNLRRDFPTLDLDVVDPDVVDVIEEEPDAENKSI